MPRPRAWATTLINTNFAAVGDTLVADLLTGLTAADTITVVRLIINLRLWPSNFTDNFDGAGLLDVAIGVSAEEAFDVGSTSLPQPGTANSQPARGWLWRDRLVGIQNVQAIEHSRIVHDVRADVRSMRKVDRGVLYLHAVSAEAKLTYPDIQLTGIVRALCLT